ncbi:hypothetical protein CNMCM5793_001908 [Aspergillus hiratsukae]|uniref:Uncharacterized protein n=1 Tax=Aspergillus hiratsukae TaxID=1194566 RepID=A0A8H6PC04_9EURO|nr:hypothetical protein CNMCM5793_001908 [Aspergillus hiratsukae]KAF7166044.1 hypothetical protein CNMCM6106_001985 [Aspergillus hiratsukae]
MDDLPFEIKRMICASAMETSRKSLQELSLVNRTWYQAAVPLLYDRLQLDLTTTEKLQADVEQLLNHPLGKKYLQYLRRLDLVGQSGKQSLRIAAEHEAAEGPIMLDDFIDRELWRRHFFRLCHRDTTTPDHAPLARYIAAVSNLREVNFVRALRFPQEVLDVLHTYHPSCKLNLHYFYLQAWKHQGLSDRDMTVVTSPCLHSIRCYYYRNAGNDEVIESAILRSLSLAPNLKKVDLVLVPEVRFVDQRTYAFELTDGGSTAVARLQTLSFSLNTVMSVHRFNQWRQNTGIEHLRTWSIGCIAEPALARTISAVAPLFQRLERLSLNLQVTAKRSVEYWRSVEEMMVALPPLKGLWLVGNRNARFLSKVLSRHGSTLQSLGLDSRNIEVDIRPQGQIRPYYNAQEIVRFANKCPVLRELHLTVHACRVQLPRADDPDEDEDFSSIPEYIARLDFASVREARTFYINAAIDAPLAASIFNTILSSQSTRRLSSLRLLPTCDLQPENRPMCLPYRIRSFSHFFHCFTVTRFTNSDPGVLNINKIPERNNWPKWERSATSQNDPFYHLRIYVVNWTWPSGRITSFPLQDV